jgi:hypothetical protein
LENESPLSLVVNPNIQRPAHEIDSIQLTNGSLSILCGMEPNKSKSPLPPIVTLGNLSTINLATLTKVIFELPPTSLPGEVANKELTSFLGGASLHVGGIVGTLVVEPTAAVTVVGTSASATLLAILTDKDGTSVEFRVLEFTDGTLGFVGLLVENDSAAFGAAIASFEDVGLKGLEARGELGRVARRS